MDLAAVDSAGDGLRSWLLESAKINQLVVEEVVNVLLFEEQIFTVDDLNVLAMDPHFDTCGIKTVNVRKIRRALENMGPTSGGVDVAAKASPDTSVLPLPDAAPEQTPPPDAAPEQTPPPDGASSSSRGASASWRRLERQRKRGEQRSARNTVGVPVPLVAQQGEQQSKSTFDGNTNDHEYAWVTPADLDEGKLEGLLGEFINTSPWGKGGTKSVAQLLGEIQSGETELVLEEGRPLRCVKVAKLRIHGGRTDVPKAERQHLVEKEQTLLDKKDADGKPVVRKRDMPLSEKIYGNETPEDAALRAVREELEGRQGHVVQSALHQTFEQKTSDSYPGLMCRYTFFELEVEILKVDGTPGLPSESRFVTKEGRIEHVWHWRDPLVRLQGGLSLKDREVRLLERLFFDPPSPYSGVRVTMMHGGLSTSKVLRTNPCFFDDDGNEQDDEPTITKLGPAEDIANEVKQTRDVEKLGGDTVRVLRNPSFTDEQSTNALVYADSTIDGPLRERLEDGTIRLLRVSWLLEPGLEVIQHMQDLESKTPEAFWSKAEAVELLQRGDRSVLAVSQ